MPSKIHPKGPQQLENVVIEDRFCNKSVTTLTVWKTSLVFNCNGFNVFDSTGNLAFRVDNYDSGYKNEVVLMDATGNSLLTMRRKRLSMYSEWHAFLKDKSDGQKPLFIVRRSFLLPTKTLAQIYVGSVSEKKHPDYQIEGSFANRSCTVYNSSRNIVAEMKRKQVSSEITLGGDVFSMIVQPGYDQTFVMGLVVILDQIGSNERHMNTNLHSRTLSLDLPRHLPWRSLSLGT
ncbi:hypothetical protein SUGI_0750800 [Cryptomeria japonica]|uniref:protein LURP-one-related 5-like n=1 Tax=Cryptomeria japonica TaxID=3369 RepID=UPI002414CA80|nr:protein LURP-one-related 5-like [Cryptomeria japonica]GLJ37055.1 hypothetical protein SUGI_0750800 [Cryptomeria japonica]